MSEERTQNIVKHFAKNAPAGQLPAVLKSVKAIVGNADVFNAAAPAACHEHNTTNLFAVAIPDTDRKVILSSFNEKDSTHYVDPVGKQIIEVDHQKQSVTNATPLEDVPADEDVRAKLQTAVDGYLKEHYKAGTASVFSLAAEGAKYRFAICINSEQFNKKAFWSGRWISSFVAKFDSETAATVEGTVVDHVHYYEDANVHFKSAHKFTSEATGGDLDATIKKVVAAIDNSEGKFHQEVDAQCSNLSEGLFKQMRRKLPLTKQLFNFGSAAHSLASELNKKSGK